MNASKAEAAGPGAAATSDPVPPPAGTGTQPAQAAPAGAATAGGPTGHDAAATVTSDPPGTEDPAAPESAAPATAAPARRGRRILGHLLLLAAYTAAGVAVTWPVTARLAGGQVIQVPDVSSYVWSLWWMAHAVSHLTNPWMTHAMAAPVGIQLGFDTLMPLPGLLMTPVTLLAGPAASFAVLTVVVPGLLCYATYRAARLWLQPAGSIAAGAFFGLATMLTWQNLYHLNISLGTVFLPLTLEAAVRLRRTPRLGQGLYLGLVLGASVLTNQESAVVATLLAAAILLPWLVQLAWRAARPAPAGAPARPAVRTLVLAAVVAVVVASPQLIAMIRQVAAGGAAVRPAELTQTYRLYGVGVPTLFTPSPRLAHFDVGPLLSHVHLGWLTTMYHFHQPGEGIPTFGIVLTVVALAGLALTWRQRRSWLLALLWAAGAALALGPTLNVRTQTFVPLASRWHGVTVSLLMPYTWLVRIPGLSALREADRLALLGLLGAAILAGVAVQWVLQHARPVVAVAVIAVVAAGGAVEAGWSANGAPTMRPAMPAVDAMLAADHSDSVVVDVPFGLRGGVGLTGWPVPPQALLLATSDGHPRAESYTSWVPQPTRTGIMRYAFYRCLYAAQNGRRHACAGPALTKAARSAKAAGIRWIVVWHMPGRASRPAVIQFFYATGFRKAAQFKTDDNGITLWRR